MISIAFLVIELAAREPGAALVAARGFLARNAALDAAASRPLFDGDDAAEQTAALLVAWSYFESRWDPSAVSPDGLDCGVMQVRRWHLPGGQCSSVKTASAGYAAALDLLRELRARCGSVTRALHAYASGSCEPSTKTNAIVSRRCALAGGC
jgi:hypothetical protein